MTVETLLDYLQQYGYIVIFVFAFFGIVGIPAPEESLIFLIGVLIAERQLEALTSVACTLGGTMAGMIAAYGTGRWIGSPLLARFGKWVGLTKERWNKTEQAFKRNSSRTIVFGFYIPGIRQISPYFSGTAGISFPRFVLLSVSGTLLWVTPFLLGGYFLGRTYHVNIEYVPYIGIFIFLLFLAVFLIKRFRKKAK